MFRSGLLAFVAVLFAAGGAASNPAFDWSLDQNVPEPFCNDEDGAGTLIGYTVADSSLITMQVWNADTTSVVRSLLVDGMRPAGIWMILWDGRDAQGARVPSGAYPYRLTAVSVDGAELLFEDTKVAHATCELPVRQASWGGIKARYRDATR